MAPKPRITEEVIHQVIAYINAGFTQIQAAEKVGRTIEGVRQAATRLNIDLPKKRRRENGHTQKLVLSLKDEIESGKRSLTSIAKEHDILQSQLSLACKQMGVKPALRWFGETNRPRYNTVENMQEVLDYVAKNGGYVSHAIEALNSPCAASPVRDYAREIGFDLAMYRVAWRRYGNWIIQPCIPQPIFTCDYKVKALCTLCGQIFDVNLVNLRTGVSKCCQECSRMNRKHWKVVCRETGEEWRSIMKFAESPRSGTRRYCTIRRKLLQNKDFEMDGMHYYLEDK